VVFALLLGGEDSGLRVPAGDVVASLLAAAHAFLSERAATGDKPAWRVRELPNGPARVARRTAATLSATPSAATLSPAPSAGRAGAALGAARSTAAAPGPGPGLAGAAFPLVGLLNQDGGGVAVGAMVPLGRLEAAAVDVLSRARRVVVTPARGVVVPDLEPTEAAAWLEALAAAGLAVEADSRWAGVTACAGKPGCAKSLADVRADADAATRHVDGLPVHWIGCARGCGSPAGRHVRVEATPAGYTVTAISEAEPATGRPATDRELADLVTAARRG
jgi:precorrin-3B synthase